MKNRNFSQKSRFFHESNCCKKIQQLGKKSKLWENMHPSCLTIYPAGGLHLFVKMSKFNEKNQHFRSNFFDIRKSIKMFSAVLVEKQDNA